MELLYLSSHLFLHFSFPFIFILQSIQSSTDQNNPFLQTVQQHHLLIFNMYSLRIGIKGIKRLAPTVQKRPIMQGIRQLHDSSNWRSNDANKDEKLMGRYKKSLDEVHHNIFELGYNIVRLRENTIAFNRKINAGVQDSDGRLNRSLVGLKESAKEVEGSMEGRTKEISSQLQEDVSGLEENVSGLKKDVGGLTRDVSALSKDVGNLDNRMTAEFRSIQVQ